MKYQGDREFIKQESWLRFNLKSDIQGAKFFSTTDVRYDPLFDSREKVELREAYGKLRWGPVDFRIGRQIVLWGKADEFNPTDFVNPEDYREFFSLSRAERKIGIFLSKIDYYRGNFKLELLVIPSFIASEIPMDTAHPWMPRHIGDFFNDPLLRISEADKPEAVLENAEFAARCSAIMVGFDFSFCVYSGYFDLPVMVRTGFIPPETVLVTPSYKKCQAAGFDFATVIQGWGVRGECAYILEGYYQTEESTDIDGIEKSSSLSFVLGTDRTIGGDVYLNLQWIEQLLFAYEEGMVEDKIENRLVASGYRKFFYDELTVGFSAMIYKVTNGDYLLHPYISYSPADGVSIETGMYLFGGPAESLFGQFDVNNCISLSVSFFF